MSNAAPSEEDVRKALGRLVAWPEIGRSPQLVKFLDYVVERRLAGESQSIKAYSIAVDVLGRPQDFDPQLDPIVRVQARRLRGLIEQYYAGPGAADIVRIVLPTGRYVPEFVVHEPTASALPSPPQQAPRRTSLGGFAQSWLTLAAVTAALLVYVLSTTQWSPPDAPLGLYAAPTISITELQNLTAPTEAGRVAGLAVELVTDLEQFEAFNVVYGQGEDTGTSQADFVLSGIVRRERGSLRYSAILTDVATNDVIWDDTIAVDTQLDTNPTPLNDVSAQLSRMLGSPRGPIHQPARDLLAALPALTGRESLYYCRVLFDLYREVATTGAGERAQSCYIHLGAPDQAIGQATAAMASLLAEGFGGGVELSREERLAQAGEMLTRALQASPISGFAWEQRARYLESVGDHAGAEAAYSSALQLNVSNTDTLAARARHLTLTGQLAAAEPLANLAIDGARNPPRWYLLVPTLAALRDENFRLATIYGQSYAEFDRELGPVLVVMAAQGLGDEGLVASYLPRVLELPAFRAHGILAQLRQRISDEALLRDIRQALLFAGVPSAVLTGPF